MKIEETQKLKGQKILVIATGSIAAVKTPLLISNLIKIGAEVRCIITPSASRLVGPVSLSTLSRNRCYEDKDQWDPQRGKPLHIELAEWADLIAIAPLSASSLSRWVNGLSEGLAASVLLASERPVIAAAAMNTGMWNNQAVRNNWRKLQEFQNVIALSPSEGLLACDRIGEGRMANCEVIQLALESAAIQRFPLEKDLQGISLLVTTGATIEDIDAARYLSNRSSGKMGVLLGQAARFRGAKVDLIHGSLQISPGLLEGINSIEARSANDMLCALEKLQTSADVIAMAAAIADIQSKKCSSVKIGKEKLLESLEDKFEIVPDLLKRLVKGKKANQVFLGFAALTGNDGEIQKLAISKKQTKGCDLLMANPIDRLNQGFGSELNGGWLIGPKNEIQKIPVNSKFSIAHHLLDAIKIQLMAKSEKINNPVHKP